MRTVFLLLLFACACGSTGTREGAPAPVTSESALHATQEPVGTAQTIESPTASPPAPEDERSMRALPPTEVRLLGPRAAEHESLSEWIAERREEAREGTRQYVRVPLVFKSDGWGCECPDNYLGASANDHAGGETWIKIENVSGQAFPAPPVEHIGGHEMSLGMVVRVDGYFSGDVEQLDLQEEVYNLNVFHVTGIHRAIPSARADRFRVALLGDSQEAPVCSRVVVDDTPLNVRERPRARANVVGTLANGTRFLPVEWHGRDWIRIDAPVAGWLWAQNTEPACE